MAQKKKFALPPQGFVFWPVGTGDTTTIVVGDEMVVQVDLHHLECSESEDDDRLPIVDRLVALLPKVGGKPYLAVFVLTHPDKDHCLGFKELLRRVQIGEIWFSPRIFREYHCDLCGDAVAFVKEAERRVAETIKAKGDVATGDTVRIIGYDELLDEDQFKGFPEDRLSIPGHSVVELDGVDCSDQFCAFIHAPFKHDADGERNDCSIAMQVELKNDTAAGYALLLGDHCYPTLKRIFEISETETLQWNVLLAPHHCSKSAMYWTDEGAEEASLHQDILDMMADAALSPGYIIASSDPIPSSNKSGDNPPHARAKKRYEETAPDKFLCTQEHYEGDNPVPIVFTLTETGLAYSAPSVAAKAAAATLTQATAFTRGDQAPPSTRVGFGNNE